MRLLLDTNLILDVLLNRPPWVQDAQALWQAHDDNKFTGYLPATTFTNIFYIVRRAVGLDRAHEALDLCLRTFEVCVVDRAGLEFAQTLLGNDFEDNVVLACAVLTPLDGIVTRDPKGFQHAPLAILTPQEALAQL